MRFPIGTLLLTALAQSAAPKDPSVEFNERWTKLSKQLANEHVAVARECTKLKLLRQAAEECRRAVALDPNQTEARAGLGQKSQGGVWVPIQPNAPAPRDETPGLVEEISPKRTALYKKAITQLLALGDFARAKGLAEKSKPIYRLVLDYDPSNEAARKGLGHVLTKGGWMTAEDAAELDAIARRVAEAPEGSLVSGKSDIETRTGFEFVKVRSAHFQLEGEYKESELKDLVKVAEAAWSDLFDMLDWKGPRSFGVVHGVYLGSFESYSRFLDAYFTAKSEGERGFMRRLAGAWIEKSSGFVYWLPGPADGHRDHTVHHVAELILGRLCGEGDPPAWLYEAAAYWLSLRIVSSAKTYCISQETGTQMRQWAGPDEWRAQVRERVRADSAPTLRAVVEASPNALDSEMAVKGWSVFDFLIRTRTKGLKKYFEEIAKKAPPETAIKNAFAVANYAELDAAWKAYVRENY